MHAALQGCACLGGQDLFEVSFGFRVLFASQPYGPGDGRWFLLWVAWGPRPQDTAATLMAQAVARMQTLPLFLTDGWKAYPAALLQVGGVGYRRAASWTRGAQAHTALGGTERPVLRASGESAGQDGPRCGGQQARELRRPTPLWQAVVSAPTRRDDPDSIDGTLVRHLAWAGGAPAVCLG